MPIRSSCTSILIGKNASADGSVMIGRNEDSKAAWPKHLVVRPAQAKAQTFTSKATAFSLTLPANALQYTATPEWTDEFGVFEEAGINSAGVAMSATESAYANARVLAYDPFVAQGILEEAMVTVVLPYITSAKAGVQRLGKLVAAYGAGEANGVLFADHDEAWYMEIATGHHWVAARIPDDQYAVVANQLAIQTVDFASPDFMFSAGLRDFAQKHDLWQPQTPFDFRRIFGTDSEFDRIYNTPRVFDGQRRLTPSRPAEPTASDLPFTLRPDLPLHVEDAFAVLGSHYQETNYDPTDPNATEGHRFRPISLARTQEAHVLQLRPQLPYPIADIHWLALGVAAESQFVPFFAGATAFPDDYRRGGLPAGLDSAYWQYKLAGVLIDAHFKRFSRDLDAVQQQTHAKLLASIAQADQASAGLSASDLAALATTASAANADIARSAWQAFTMQLLQTSTDLSPLNFNTDANL
ncbi:C69 family dipeptidase [Lacticaseibacillus baoqingensis]|uniref:Dipeptidase n=1 Tax=Lacticaseibacillus baoqingensis TaxID=2486013 RepID=A0ABW4E987_9LACO|nr:C69 family dipeptidase [Lacticaseibacillus baoqingensis]